MTNSGLAKFSIDPTTGTIRLARMLDYENGDRTFLLTITATDGGTLKVLLT